MESFNTDQNLAGDWRKEIKNYLDNPNLRVPYRVKVQARQFVLIGDDLYRKSPDGLLLRCLGFVDYMEVMKQVHEGVCGTHQAGIKMRWLIRRQGRSCLCYGL